MSCDLTPFSRLVHLSLISRRGEQEVTIRDSCGEGIERKRAKDGKTGTVRDRRRNLEEVFGACFVSPLPVGLSDLGGPSGI